MPIPPTHPEEYVLKKKSRLLRLVDWIKNKCPIVVDVDTQNGHGEKPQRIFKIGFRWRF